jgi:hypothetical protein
MENPKSSLLADVVVAGGERGGIDRLEQLGPEQGLKGEGRPEWRMSPESSLSEALCEGPPIET